MHSYLLVRISVVIITVPPCSCWQYYSTFSEVKPTSYHIKKVEHSEYVFGFCKRADNVLYTRTHLNHMNILGKFIVRGWIDVPRIPTCIRLNAVSYPEDRMQNTGYQFQVCVPRIGYIHSQQRVLYYFYEWYIPWDYHGGMDWEISFYGAPGSAWWKPAN